MSVLGRLRRGNSAEVAALRAALEDLGRANHLTAHTSSTGLAELRAQLALVDPANVRAVCEAVESMLTLVSAAVEDAQAARDQARAADREVALVRARLERLEEALAHLGAASAEPAPADA